MVSEISCAGICTKIPNGSTDPGNTGTRGETRIPAPSPPSTYRQCYNLLITLYFLFIHRIQNSPQMPSEAEVLREDCHLKSVVDSSVRFDWLKTRTCMAHVRYSGGEIRIQPNSTAAAIAAPNPDVS